MIAPERLWNELHLRVGPAVLGSGTPMFDGGLRAPLDLLGSRKPDGSALVLRRYGVRRH